MSTTSLKEFDQRSGTPIISIYAGEAIYAPLLAEFVADLSSNVAEIGEAIAERNSPKAQHLAHRLRGAAATYGYPEMAAAVGLIEDLIKSNEAKLLPLDIANLERCESNLAVLAARIELGMKLRRL